MKSMGCDHSADGRPCRLLARARRPAPRAWRSGIALAIAALGAPAASATPAGISGGVDIYGGYYAASPNVYLSTPELFTVKALDGVAFRPRHAVAYAGVGIDARLFPGVPLVYFPLVGLHGVLPFNWSVSTTYGPSDTGGSVDLGNNGSNFSYLLHLNGPGVGVEQAVGGFKLGAEGRTRLTYVFAPGTISQGLITADVSGNNISLALTGDAHGCVNTPGLGGWTCLFVAPTVFDSSASRWWNGFHIGIRGVVP